MNGKEAVNAMLNGHKVININNKEKGGPVYSMFKTTTGGSRISIDYPGSDKSFWQPKHYFLRHAEKYNLQFEIYD